MTSRHIDFPDLYFVGETLVDISVNDAAKEIVRWTGFFSVDQGIFGGLPGYEVGGGSVDGSREIPYDAEIPRRCRQRF